MWVFGLTVTILKTPTLVSSAFFLLYLTSILKPNLFFNYPFHSPIYKISMAPRTLFCKEGKGSLWRWAGLELQISYLSISKAGLPGKYHHFREKKKKKTELIPSPTPHLLSIIFQYPPFFFLVFLCWLSLCQCPFWIFYSLLNPWSRNMKLLIIEELF